MSDQSAPGQSTAASLRLAYGLALFAVLAFGATLPVTHIALEDYSPGFLTFARALLAAALALALLKVTGKPWRHRDDLLIFIAGITLIFTFPGFMALAMQTVPASHGGVVLGFLPFTTAIFARLIAKEKPSPFFWLISLSGCAVVVIFTALQSDELGNAGISTGDLWLVAAGITVSIGYVLLGKVSRSTPGWEVIARALVLNLPLILVGVWWTWEPQFLDAGIRSTAALLYLGSFSMFIAFCAWNAALAIGGIARIGQM